MMISDDDHHHHDCPNAFLISIPLDSVRVTLLVLRRIR